MQILLEKLNELPDAIYPNNIDVGFKKVGDLINPPKVGEAFYIGYYWCTSVVVGIIDDNTFRTLNSIYKWSKYE